MAEQELESLARRSDRKYWLSFAQNPIPGITGLFEMQPLKYQGSWESSGKVSYKVGLTDGDLPIPDLEKLLS